MAAPRFLILADGDFGPMTSKTANSVIRYLPDRTVAVLDRQQAGQDGRRTSSGSAAPFRWSARCGPGWRSSRTRC